MTAADTGRRVARALAAIVSLLGFAPGAQAIEVFDGRIQAHGFAEMQVRGLNRNFSEELDLAQWYNVVNVEIEIDFLPDGWGPFDLLQGYARIEGRYDCIYSRGCGIVPNARVYGNDSQDLPLRLRDGDDFDFSGAIDTNAQADPEGIVRRISPTIRNPAGWAVLEGVDTPITISDPTDVNKYHPGLQPPSGFFGVDPKCPVTSATDSVDEPDQPDTAPGGPAPGCIDNRKTKTVVRRREGFPGFDTLFDTKGADGELGNNQDYEVLGVAFYDPDLESLPPETAGLGAYERHFRGLTNLRDDPGFYTFEPVIDWKFAHRSFPGAVPSGTALPMGPWLPTNEWDTLSALRDRAHPLRGRISPLFLNVDGVLARSSGVRYHDLDCDAFGPMDPRCDGFVGPDKIDVDYPADPVDPRLIKLDTLLRQMAFNGLGLREFNVAGQPRLVLAPGPENGIFNGVRGVTPFGGDYSGIIPCFAPDKQVGRRITGGLTEPNSNHIDQLAGASSSGGTIADTRRGCIPWTNVRVTGGFSELPMRVAPDWSNLALLTDGFDAQGIYIPSFGLLEYVAAGGDFDDPQFNFSEIDRSFNHGASQSDTYELKEAYLDMEFLDSRLWIRAGIQNIVWGKTELFRTTDQFNPQDLALASLPALEESRIALLSWRAVYSLYDVGPLEDVRLEFAMNFDRVKPADLGACGEPYTPDIVCGLTLGSAIHSISGIGVAAYDRPPNGWEDVDGLEFGGRIEFRWDRFSFAIVDFYGYNDFPFPEPIFFYERNVDPNTGLPRKANATGVCNNRAAFVVDDVFGTGVAGKTVIHAGDAFGESMLREERLADGVPGFEGGDQPGIEEREKRPTGLEDNFTTAATNDDWWRRKEAYSLLGIGHDSGCLKPGGAPAFPNENRLDERLVGDPEDFARYSNIDGSIDEDTYVGFTVGANAAGENTALQWTREGFSEDYALVYHPGNQQLFSFICSATVTIAVGIAPEACAWNLWGSDSLLVNDNAGAPFSEGFAVLFAGDREFVDDGTLMNLVIDNTKKSNGELGQIYRQFGIATLNSDVRDGRTGATHDDYNIRTDILDPEDPFFGLHKKDQARDILDIMTLDNSLTWQQKALLGCGPAYGTRCDSGAAAVRVQILECDKNKDEDGNDLPFPDSACPDVGNPIVTSKLIDLVDLENETVARNGSRRFRILKNPDTCTPTANDDCACPPEDLSECRIWARGGGIDFLNAEASVIVQSFSGFEGTTGRTKTDYFIENWVTWAKDTPQPGTIGVSRVGTLEDPGDRESFIESQAHIPFEGGVVCSRYAPDSPYADSTGLVKLPGCRGAVSATVVHSTSALDRVIEVEFDSFYSPHVDGCMFGLSMQNQAGDTYYVQAMRRNGSGQLEADVELQNELYETCFNNNQNMLDDPKAPGGERVNIHAGDLTWFSYTRRRSADQDVTKSNPSLGAGHLFHPLAQCEQAGRQRAGAPIDPMTGLPSDPVWNPGFINKSLRPPEHELVPKDLNDPTSLDPQWITRSQNLCLTLNRDYENDFLEGHAQVFTNELAAISWNIQAFLTISSCNDVSGDDDVIGVKECFDPNRPYAASRCSFSAPQFCRNVKGFLGVAGLSRNDPRAGGNANFGRRDFIWHSGGEVALRYKRRNVFGVSADFAEDRSKTNWGVEFTWIGKQPWGDNNSLSNTTLSDTFNLTISVDRPTFINFLNANRTFFFNTQWFFNYIPEHGKGFTQFRHPFNVLFTFAVFTGYYQDRFLPQIITVYDFGSHSAGVLPQLQYRFTEAFSVTFGVSFFFGRGEFVPMPVRGFAPDANRAGPNAYQDGVLRLLALISRRDEMWMRLRWTF